MSMSKKDFIALADLIKANRVAFPQLAVELLCWFCASQNPNFNRDRWLSYIAGECGPSGGSIKKGKS